MALFLHYKLDNHGMGKPNISICSDTKSFKNTSVYIHSSDENNTTVEKNDEYARVFFNKDGNNGGVYLNFFPKTSRNNGEKYTWSIDIRTNSDFIFSSLGLECSGLLSDFEIKNTDNNWVRLSHTFVYDENQSQYFYFVLYVSNAKNGQFFDIKNFKVETGEDSTGWIPTSFSEEYKLLNMNSNEVKDVSNKYNVSTKKFDISNDGLFKSLDISYVDSPRYLCGTDFSNNNFIKGTSNIDVSSFSNSYTISFFAYIKNTNNQIIFSLLNGYTINFSINNYFYLNSKNNSECFKVLDDNENITDSIISAKDYTNDWHNFTIVGDGTYNYLYIDGIKIGRTSSFFPLSGNNLIISGNSETNNENRFNGYLSDFRIYSEILSDSKIMKNYNVSLYITEDSKLCVSSIVEE